MKLEKHRYEDVVILKFTGEFDTFNLPAFSERIDRMIDGGDTQMVFDLRLLKFINSAALGYLIKTAKRLAAHDEDRPALGRRTRLRTRLRTTASPARSRSTRRPLVSSPRCTRASR